MAVSIILPYFNPSPGWAANVTGQFSELQKRIHEPLQFILVNDGSTGSSVAEIEIIKDRVPDVICVAYDINKGKGYAIRQGVAKATGNILIYTDIDFPYTNDSVIKIYETLKTSNSDVAVGVKNNEYYHSVPRSRRFVSKLLRRMIRTFFTIPISDTQCGLKGFKNEIKPLFLQTTINRYLFDLEFIRNCHKEQYGIAAVPIELKQGIQFSKVDYSILLPEVINLFRLIFRWHEK